MTTPGKTHLLLAPAVHRPILLWAREAGITAAGQLLLTVNTLDPVIVHLDLNEGRQMDVGCVFCGTDVVATIGAAYPVRLYVVSLYCERCGQPLVTFGQFDQHMALITSAAGAR